MRPVGFVLLLTLVGLCLCNGQIMKSPSQVVTSANSLNGKYVQVRGIVADMESFTNTSGEEALRFRLSDNGGNTVTVTLTSWPAWLRNGSDVVVDGQYFSEYRIGSVMLFENTIVYANVREYDGNALDLLQQLIK